VVHGSPSSQPSAHPPAGGGLDRVVSVVDDDVIVVVVVDGSVPERKIPLAFVPAYISVLPGSMVSALTSETSTPASAAIHVAPLSVLSNTPFPVPAYSVPG